jgi:hypothetical protein
MTKVSEMGGMDGVIKSTKFSVDQLIDVGCMTSRKETLPHGRPYGSYNRASAAAQPVKTISFQKKNVI